MKRMGEKEFVKLDFSDPRAPQLVNELLERLSKDSPFYEGLLFCKAWLAGNDFFSFHSSGSTGESKLLKVARSQIVDSVNRTSRFFKLEEGQHVLVCLNTRYTGGKMMLARALHIKMKVFWVEARQDPFDRVPMDTHFSLVALVPSQMKALIQRDDHPLVLGMLKTILLGGAPVTEDLKSKLEDIEMPFVYETFGMTETLSHIAVRKLNGKGAEKVFSLLEGVDVQIDERGCLMVKAGVTNNEWVVSNDLVEMMDRSHFVWKGRIDYVINSGGVKILPEELEELLLPMLRSLGIKGEFMLSSIPDPLLGQKLVLYVEEPIRAPNSTLAILKTLLPPFHTPKEIIEMNKLPRTVSGKLKRI